MSNESETGDAMITTCEGQENTSAQSSRIAYSDERDNSTEIKERSETDVPSDDDDPDGSYDSGDNEPIDEEEERRKIAQAMRVYESAELRKKLHIVQQQLHSFHDLTAEMDALKARNSQLKGKVSGLLEDRTRREEKVKKTVGKKVRTLEDEIIGLKLELAQSRGKEDYHNAEMRHMIDEKKKLETEVEKLQLQNAKSGQSSMLHGLSSDNNPNRVQASMKDFFKSSNQKPPSRST